jgi:hypothetical protein
MHFPIKAAVEFVARGASIWGLDAGGFWAAVIERMEASAGEMRCNRRSNL